MVLAAGQDPLPRIAIEDGGRGVQEWIGLDGIGIQIDVHPGALRHGSAVLDEAIGIIGHGRNLGGAGDNTAAGAEPRGALGINKRV